MHKQDFYNDFGACGSEVGCMEEKGKKMRAGGNWGETERLQAMKNGFSMIPHEVKGARGFCWLGL